MENLDNLKTMWIELNRRLESVEAENVKLASEIKRNRYKSSQEKLIDKYKKFIFIEALMAFVMPYMIIANPLVDSKYRWITTIYWILFFLFELGVDLYLLNGVKAIDIYHDSMQEIASKALKNWKMHKIAILIGFPMAFGAVILFGLCFGANSFMLVGMICGGVVGAMIGLYQLRKFRNYYKDLYAE